MQEQRSRTGNVVYNTFVMTNMSSIEQVAGFLTLISQSARLQILLAIGEGESCVCHLTDTFHWKQAYLSQHLMPLRKAGIVVATRRGRYIHYRLADSRLLGLIRQAAEVQGVSLPELAPSETCACPDCRNEKGCE
jgi:ArsR family transcriptional regulator, arsenate/arsenite/antimonite-responsive transcriptional repressor